MVKSLEGFVLSEICFALVKFCSISPVRLHRIMKKALLMLQFFKVLRLFSIYLIILSSGKEIIVLEKILEKVLNFGSKNLYELCSWIC